MTERDGGPWHKSSASLAGNACVEVELGVRAVRVRDSKANQEADQTVIEVSAEEWTSFQAALVVSPGEGSSGPLSYRGLADGGTELSGPGGTLGYTATEWQAFLAGVRAEEFCVA